MVNTTKKILIAIKNNFVRESYYGFFHHADFEVFLADDGNKVLKMVKSEKPSAIIADVDLPKINGFGLLERIKGDKTTNLIPVIIYTGRTDEELKKDKERAIDLEARDFISATETTPAEVVRKVRIILGEQKSYRLVAETESYNAKELMEDLAGNVNFKCGKCGSVLILYLIRDLSRGEDYYKVSLMCPKCL